MLVKLFNHAGFSKDCAKYNRFFWINRQCSQQQIFYHFWTWTLPASSAALSVGSTRLQWRCPSRAWYQALEPRHVELDIKPLSRDTDPFMYYSIPGVHRASMYLQDIGHSNTEALCSSEVQTPRSRSSPPTNKKPKRSTTVTRRTNISCEAHPDVIMAELLDELEDLSEDVVKSLDW